MTPRNGELLIAATQDFITGGYLLTKRNVFFTHDQACQLASTLIASDDVTMHIDLPTPAIMKVSFGSESESLTFRCTVFIVSVRLISQWQFTFAACKAVDWETNFQSDIEA